jgi:3-phosphoshikimate 1-carboxyvinyltransferase
MSAYPDVLEITAIDRPIEAVVRPPGSKSLTNRALVVASLAAGGASRLEGGLEADDTVVMRDGLRALGVLIDDVDDPWLVLGTGGALAVPQSPLDAGASGTTARFLTAVAALVPVPVTIDGTPRLRERPIGELVDALSAMGVDAHAEGGTPPVTVTGGRLRGGFVTVDASRSSQFLSAILMVAPLADGPTEVAVSGGDLVSEPYVRSTLEVMSAFACDVEVQGDRYLVPATGYRPTHFDVEADASAAAYPLIATAILGGTVAIGGIPSSSGQADLRLLDVLTEMGCLVHRRSDHLLLAGPSRPLRGVDVDMSDAPDAALALAVTCVFADGPSTIRGLSTLRLKETDRLAALERELRKIGADARVEGDALRITPGRLRGARIETYDDHRMAMSFAVAGLRQPGIEIIDPGCVTKTWPGFFTMLEAL